MKIIEKYDVDNLSHVDMALNRTEYIFNQLYDQDLISSRIK